jgi:phosphoribosyl 1,2-cyclic phosphodiesterase
MSLVKKIEDYRIRLRTMGSTGPMGYSGCNGSKCRSCKIHRYRTDPRFTSENPGTECIIENPNGSFRVDHSIF